MLGQAARARARYGTGRRMSWGVAEADGNDDYLFSLALTVEAGKGLGPRVARGHMND